MNKTITMTRTPKAIKPINVFNTNLVNIQLFQVTMQGNYFLRKNK